MRKKVKGKGKVKNSVLTSKREIQRQMLEARPLPMGRKEFEEWSDRIISGSLVVADIPSQKFALANMLMHLGPTESHKPDAFFIHSLRKFAVNQVADEVRKELYEAKKAKEEAEKTPEQKEKEASDQLAGENTLRRLPNLRKALKDAGPEDTGATKTL